MPDPQEFAQLTVQAVLEHKDHGGWYETAEGLRCRDDDELVCPSGQWLVDVERCACGAPLHYTDADVETEVRRLIDLFGEYVPVTIEGGGGTWRVQRHYIALHGLKASDLPELGLFERIA